MIAPDRQRDGSFADNRGHAGFDTLQCILEIDGIDRKVADVCDIRSAEGFDTRHMMRPSHQARLAADFSRPMARAGAIGRPAIPRNADQCDVQALG